MMQGPRTVVVPQLRGELDLRHQVTDGLARDVIAREALKDIRPIYADFGKPENLQFLAHEGGHVIDVPALMTFFGKHLEAPVSDN